MSFDGLSYLSSLFSVEDGRGSEDKAKNGENIHIVSVKVRVRVSVTIGLGFGLGLGLG